MAASWTSCTIVHCNFFRVAFVGLSNVNNNWLHIFPFYFDVLKIFQCIRYLSTRECGWEFESITFSGNKRGWMSLVTRLLTNHLHKLTFAIANAFNFCNVRGMLKNAHSLFIYEQLATHEILYFVLPKVLLTSIVPWSYIHHCTICRTMEYQ